MASAKGRKFKAYYLSEEKFDKKWRFGGVDDKGIIGVTEQSVEFSGDVSDFSMKTVGNVSEKKQTPPLLALILTLGLVGIIFLTLGTSESTAWIASVLILLAGAIHVVRSVMVKWVCVEGKNSEGQNVVEYFHTDVKQNELMIQIKKFAGMSVDNLPVESKVDNNGEDVVEGSLFEWLYPKGYRPYQIRWYDIAISVALFAIAAIGYISTLTPSVTPGDSGELTTAVYNMGACHPPGYPLYGILGKLFCFIPINDIAYRVNLFSAISGAGAVLFLYLIIVKLLGFNRDKKKLSLSIQLPAIAATFMFAFSMSHWSQAVIGEVYALNALLVSAMLFVMLIWFEELIFFRKEEKLHFAERTTYLLAFIMGLSLTDHQLPLWFIGLWFVFLVIPALIIIASERPPKFTEEFKKRLPVVLLFGVTVIIALALMYFRAYKTPHAGDLILQEDIGVILLAIFIIPAFLTVYAIIVKMNKLEDNWVDRVMKIFMVSYWLFFFAMTIYLYMLIRARAVAPLAEPKPLSWGDTQRLDILFNHMLRKQYGSTPGNLNDMWGQIKAVFQYNVEQFNWLNLVFAGIGVVFLFMKDKMWGIFSASAVVLFSLIMIKFINFETDPRTLSFQEVFFIQEFMVVAIYVGFGYQALIDFATKGTKLFKREDEFA